MSNKQIPFEQFQDLLREMFQYDHNDLDFGIFKILKLKRTYVEQFIAGDTDQDLKHIIARELATIRSTETKEEQESLAQHLADLGKRTREAWAELEITPNDPQKQEKLRKSIIALEDDADRQQSFLDRLERWLKTQRYSVGHLEAQLYNYLLNFFELYYQNGDFGYNTRASSAFKVPYEADYDGSDTLFHWKHKDSYYIKTANSFPEVRVEVQGKKIVFRLDAGGEDAAETSAQNNNKEADIKHYRLADIREENGEWIVRFQLATGSTSKSDIYAALWKAAFNAGDDIACYLSTQPKGDKPAKSVFKDLGKDYDKAEGGQIKGINQLRLNIDSYYDLLAENEAFQGKGNNKEARAGQLRQDPAANALYQFDRALNRFYAGQDADYFIHKDLRGFLTREKDRFIKNIIFSDLETLLDRKVETATLIIARAFNAIATRIIEFLDATETFQRNLFTLKKKVIDTHWLISVGKIPEHFWPGLLVNTALLRYFKNEFKQDVTCLEDLRRLPTLVVDTSLFTSADQRTLIDAILSDPAFDDLDEQTDGLLIHSENWQVLNLLQEKYRERIKCIYIDPPYNTGGDGFLYKDSFRHSSWAAMIQDRLAQARPLLSMNGALFASIDEIERQPLQHVLDDVFGSANRVEELIWVQNTTHNDSPTYSTNHEYVEVYASNKTTVEQDQTMFREPKPGYFEIMELVERLRSQYPPIAEVEAAIKVLMDEHLQQFKQELEEFGLEYDEETKKIDPWKGIYNYCHAEYRDFNHKYVEELRAQTAQAMIWVWQEGDASMPSGKQAISTKDPLSNNYRFYEPLHPNSKKSCPYPKRGWAYPFNTDDQARPSFKKFDDDRRISYGENERKVPRLKKFLHEMETNVSKSVIHDYTDGERELANILGGSNNFPNPKPTTIIRRMVSQTTKKSDVVMDFFVGSGTTVHAVIAENHEQHGRESRRFIASEMGDYFDRILKPRTARVMYSLNWKDGSPMNTSGSKSIVKIQRFEQYEDVIANLESAWDSETLPQGVPVRYLFRPEQNRVVLSLNLAKPFGNAIRAGKSREEKPLDLLESWAYLQGYWQRSRRVHVEGDKRYLCLETVCGCLVLLRDIAEGEDDSAALNAIAARYRDAEGALRVQRMEVNHWADLRRLKLPCKLIMAHDFDQGAAWN